MLAKLFCYKQCRKSFQRCRQYRKPFWLFLILVITFQLVISNSVTNGANFDELPVPNNTLRLVQVLYRHGDRSPTHTYPKDIHQEDAWPQGWGQLSKIGMLQQYHLGKYLKSRYMINFLNDSYVHSEIRVRSSDRDRTLMSAYCNLLGMYSVNRRRQWKANMSWQPIPVHTVPKPEDHLLYEESYCPKYSVLRREFDQSPVIQELIQKYKDFINFIANHTGMNPTLMETIRVRDPVFCEKTHNFSQPSWLTDEVFSNLTTLSNLGFKYSFPTLEMQRLRGGPLVDGILKAMQEKIRNVQSPLKMVMYSAHDTTIAALLATLGIFNNVIPPYASCVMIELHEVADKQFAVQIMFRNVSQSAPYVLQLKDCSKMCPLDQFTEITKPMIPSNITKECEVAVYSGPSGTTIAVFTMSSILAAIIFGVVVYYCLHKKKNKKIDIAYKRLQIEEGSSDELNEIS